jgi:cytochrome c peroxidase
VVAFLASLTSERYAKLGQTELARQRGRKNVRPQRDTATATGKKGDVGDLAPNPDLKNPAELGVFGKEAP